MSATVDPAVTRRHLMAEGIAKRRGIDASEVESILMTLDQEDRLDDIDQFVQRVEKASDVLGKLPADTRTQALNVIAGGTMRPTEQGDEGLRKMIREVTVIREAMRGGEGDSGVQKQIEGLTKTISDMKEADQARKLEEMQTMFKNELAQVKDSLETQLAGLQPGSPEKGTITAALDQIQEVTQGADKIKEALGLNKPSESTDPSTAAESLRKLGYKVEGPKTFADIEKMMNERVKEAVESAVKQTKDQLKSDDRKMQMLVDLGGAIIDGVMPALTAGEGGQGVAQGLGVAKKALQAATSAS